LAVLNLFVFALAIMDGVASFSLERPGYALLAVAMAFLFNLLLQGLGWLAFRGLGAVTALTVALMAGNCNMGLVLVALSGRVDVAPMGQEGGAAVVSSRRHRGDAVRTPRGQRGAVRVLRQGAV